MPGLITVLIALALGGLAGAWITWVRIRAGHESVRAQAEHIMREAEIERDRLLKSAEVDAKATLLAGQEEHEKAQRRDREELAGGERRLRQREISLERKSEGLERKERDVKAREAQVEASEARARGQLQDAQERMQHAVRELERVAGLSREQAHAELVASLEADARGEAAMRIRRIEEEAKREANDRAVRIVAAAVQRLAGGYVSEKTVSVVELPSDDMKGRIIGREGRNIRALEQVTGADIIIDDTPEAVVVSAFDPMRREIARLALERLVDDGRIHPARIEEVVEQVAETLDEEVQRAGEQATFELGLHGLHPELVRLLGKLRFRNVNGQNLWNHSVETAFIAGLIASELGLDAPLAKRAGLLHDIGKAVDHEVEGNHAQVGAEQARRCGESAEVVRAIRHYHDSDPPSVLATIVQIADTLSRSRPGARRELIETYIKRMQDLERISLAFKGVQRAYAVQAGRELRVMVDFEQVSDDEAVLLSRDIARRIEDTLTYPGEVRITVIREARATELAR